LLENNDIAAAGEGIATYIQAIPYMLYAWAAVLLVLLVTLGVVPDFGPMRKAERQAQLGGASAMQSVQADGEHNFAMKSMEEEFEGADREGGKLYNFVVPLLLLVGFTIYFDIDVWMGMIATMLLTVPFYMVQRLMPLAEMLEQMMDGFKTMLPAIGICIAAFIFKDVCDQLMLPQYVVESLKPYMTPQMLPAMVFLCMAVLSFATGSSWGIFAVTIPIVMPLAFALEADVPLVIGALMSASAFGSQACFYSDSTVLAAQGSGCNLISHAVTQLPYTLVAAGFAFIGFILIA